MSNFGGKRDSSGEPIRTAGLGRRHVRRAPDSRRGKGTDWMSDMDEKKICRRLIAYGICVLHSKSLDELFCFVEYLHITNEEV